MNISHYSSSLFRLNSILLPLIRSLTVRKGQAFAYRRAINRYILTNGRQTFGLGTALLALFLLSPLGLRAADRPNIILCMADDQGWGDTGYNGHPLIKTPHLDKMAAQGLRFDRFYAAHPVCSPTRGSVMTGRHPNRYACFTWGHTLRPQEITVAEALKTRGYATGHFGKWHLGPVREGSPVNPGASGFDLWLSAPNFYDNNPILSRGGKAIQTEGESSMVAANAAIRFIRRQVKNETPFLAVVWFGSPHGPHRAATRDKAVYPDDAENRDWMGEITGVDRAVGKLRHALRNMEVQDETLFWYTSDNGGLKRQSTGGRARKGSIYEGGLRVPGIIEWPNRIQSARAVQMPGSTSDIYPTLLDIVGIDLKGQPPVDGISLVPVIEGEMSARPDPIGFWKHPAGGVRTPSADWMPQLLKAQQSGDWLGRESRLRLESAHIDKQYPTDRFPGHAAWLDWPWKLHRKENKQSDKVSFELYNLAKDPMEEQNVAEHHAARVDSMKTGLEDWQKSVRHSMNGDDYE